LRESNTHFLLGELKNKITGKKTCKGFLHFSTIYTNRALPIASKESGAPCLNAVSDSIYQAVKERYKKRGTE